MCRMMVSDHDQCVPYKFQLINPSLKPLYAGKYSGGIICIIHCHSQIVLTWVLELDLRNCFNHVTAFSQIYRMIKLHLNNSTLLLLFNPTA